MNTVDLLRFPAARIAQLEAEVREAGRAADERLNVSLDAASLLNRSGGATDADVETLEKRVAKLTRQIDMLRVEVCVRVCVVCVRSQLVSCQ